MADVRDVPDEVEIREAPRDPVTDPTLGIEVPARAPRPARHRLVTHRRLADARVHERARSTARTCRGRRSPPTSWGWPPTEFRFPTYEWPTGPGGLPLDLERLARAFEAALRAEAGLLGDRRAPGCGCAATWTGVEDYWERAPGSATPPTGAPFHNMGVYGWDVLDAQLLTATIVAARIEDRPRTTWSARWSSTTRTGPPGRSCNARAAAPRPRTRAGRGGATWRRSGEGVETLVVMLGANNALGSVGQPRAAPGPRRATPSCPPSSGWRPSGVATCCRPSAFAADWALLVERAARRSSPARHRGDRAVGDDRPDRPRPRRQGAPRVALLPATTRGRGSPTTTSTPSATRTSPATRPGPSTPRSTPTTRRSSPRSRPPAATASTGTCSTWAALLDRLATRRYINSPWARPAWWTPVRAARARCRALDPVPNTRFFRAGPRGPHRRRAVLPRRRPPDDHRVRRRGPGGHPRDGAGRGRRSATGTATRAPGR